MEKAIFYCLLLIIILNVQLQVLKYYFPTWFDHCHNSSSKAIVPLHKQQQKTITDISEYQLLALIVSSKNTKSRRIAVRNTWGSNSYNLEFRHVFAVSENIIDTDLTIEQQMYKDVVILRDVIDDYRHLSSKVIQSIIYCQKNFRYKFLLKTDDDSFVNVKAMLNEIQLLQNNYAEGQAIYAGKLITGVNIRTKGKWADLELAEYYKLQRYPPYMQGGGYLLSRKITEYLQQTEELFGLHYAASEDVSVGMWLLSINVTIVDWQHMLTLNLPRFRMNDTSNYDQDTDLCRQNPSLLVVHRVSENDMALLHHKLQLC
eukprot:TRINITY_DN25752_c0_g1_i1.p1 TRINITY_DN25752_c0_g1~~TRINITY_DN25752_c0_g1_i1.p1  ORF type:complete len:316 (-),score=17.45 TRINITY_DN25752_c0_g1_i1:88-1035(-)